MSVRDALRLTKQYNQDTNSHEFLFALTEHLLISIKEISDFCEDRNWDITSLPMFCLDTNDW
jgi:hypothetical protein